MAIKPPRLTMQGLKVLAALERAQESMYGLQLMELTKIRSGAIYPILKRFKRAGILSSSKEQIDQREEGRPARTYYALTQEGKKYVRNILAELTTRP